MATISLRCPDCAEKFKWPASDAWPNFCPFCKADVSQDPEQQISMPFISKAKNKSADVVYRTMEKGAEHRAQVAAEMTGQPISEFSDMKLTDMKDNAKPGESSEIGISPDNQVAAAMREQGTPSPAAFAQRANLIAQSANVATGKFANAGAKMQSIVRERHATYVPQGVSSLPALETESPLYRKRVR